MALTATLGAALATGVAGGSAAAAATSASPHAALSDAIISSSAASLAGGLAGLDPPDPNRAPDTNAGDPATTAWQPSMPRIGDAADAVRQKGRPRAAAIRSAHAAWVNPNPTGHVTSCFGPRWGRMHEGVDLAAPDGSPIVAAGAGIVVRAGVAEGYGNAVLIDHGDGYLTHYGHLSVIAVKVGQHVAAGQQIGNEGSTGHSTGPHLHFEVHRGFYQNPIEPTAWMREHGVDIPGCA